jgi:hypothetical protein
LRNWFFATQLIIPAFVRVPKLFAIACFIANAEFEVRDLKIFELNFELTTPKTHMNANIAWERDIKSERIKGFGSRNLEFSVMVFEGRPAIASASEDNLLFE